MWPLFIAHGPAFKQGFKSEAIKMVDIYPLMCHVLGIQPHKCDGTFTNVKHLVTVTHTEEETHIGVSVTVITCKHIFKNPLNKLK